jgi:uncharacterized tellurite resistance protein B-like protein
MIDLVKRFFGKSEKSRAGEESTNASHDTRIAAGAILLEMANIDGEFSDSEKESIVAILKKDFRLADEHAQSLLQASQDELNGSVDLWQFTNLINQNYSRDEKRRIMETVWRVAYMDGRLDKHEDYLMHKLANLLRLTHKELIDAKIRVLHEV